MMVPPSETSYAIWFFNSGYPKARDAFAPDIQTIYYLDAPSDGAINYVETLDNLGMAADNTQIYSVVDLSSSGPGGQRAEAFRLECRKRNALEGTQSELVRAHGLRQARYRGSAMVALQNYMIGAACNAKRWIRRLQWQHQQERCVQTSQKTT